MTEIETTVNTAIIFFVVIATSIVYKVWLYGEPPRWLGEKAREYFLAPTGRGVLAILITCLNFSLSLGISEMPMVSPFTKLMAYGFTIAAAAIPARKIMKSHGMKRKLGSKGKEHFELYVKILNYTSDVFQNVIGSSPPGIPSGMHFRIVTRTNGIATLIILDKSDYVSIIYKIAMKRGSCKKFLEETKASFPKKIRPSAIIDLDAHEIRIERVDYDIADDIVRAIKSTLDDLGRYELSEMHDKGQN